MRHSRLDISHSNNRWTTQATTVVRMKVEPANRIHRRQSHTQNELCVPSVTMDGRSYRPNKRPGQPDRQKGTVTE
jgi:hypothetical protein